MTDDNNNEYQGPMMLDLIFDDGTKLLIDYTSNGLSESDLEIIRTHANISGKISLDKYEEAGFEDIRAVFPAILQMTEVSKLKYQCLVFRKICEACTHKIAYIKDNYENNLTKHDHALKHYWLTRKMCTCAHKNLTNKLLKKLKEQEMN